MQKPTRRDGSAGVVEIEAGAQILTPRPALSQDAKKSARKGRTDVDQRLLKVYRTLLKRSAQ